MRRSIPVLAAAAAALLTAGAALPSPAPAHAATEAAGTTHISGTLQPGFATTTPATLTVLTPYRGLVTVNVDSNTTIVRRYNGASALDEFSPGDRIAVVGAMSGTTLAATGLKDFTIQKAFTRNYGVITAMNSDDTQLTVRVLTDRHAGSNTPFGHGQLIYLSVTPAMSVTLSDGSTGTVSDNLDVGMNIVSLGTFNRHSRTMQSVARIRVVTPQVGATTQISGLLQPGFSTSVPTTLTLQTANHGTVTISLDANAKLVRRYNGPSSLAEFSPNDRLNVVGKYQGGSSYTAVRIKDITIQRADTFMVGSITAINGSTITATVQADDRYIHRGKVTDPFRVGQSVTLNLSPSTIVTLANGTAGAATDLQTGMTVSAVGVFNRKGHGFTTVSRVHVLK